MIFNYDRNFSMYDRIIFMYDIILFPYDRIIFMYDLDNTKNANHLFSSFSLKGFSLIKPPVYT